MENTIQDPAAALTKITFARHTNGEVSIPEVIAAVVAAVMSVISSVLVTRILRPGVNSSTFY